MKLISIQAMSVIIHNQKPDLKNQSSAELNFNKETPEYEKDRYEGLLGLIGDMDFDNESPSTTPNKSSAKSLKEKIFGKYI